MKILNGTELADFIKERQAKQVRGLRQAYAVMPKLAIVKTNDDPVINTYIRLKKNYGSDILVEVDEHFVSQNEIAAKLNELNNDQSVHGVIVQLPLSDPKQTDEIVNMVSPAKDVDALGKEATLDAATPTAILWLLNGYNVELRGKKILIIGRGKLVGAPLEKIMKASNLDVEIIGREVEDLKSYTECSDIIITATGSPAILFPDMIKQGAVVVDAGVASESGKTVGDLHETVYEREDLTLTPKKGGVGPLTVCALFENVIIAARNNVEL